MPDPFTAYQRPVAQAVPMAPSNFPSFGSFVTPAYEVYVDKDGNSINIPVDANGNPLIPVPAGYQKSSEANFQTAQKDTTVEPVAQAPVAPPQREEDPSDGRELGGGPAGLTMNQSKRKVLEQLDPNFKSKINLIQNKYNTPFDIIGE